MNLATNLKKLRKEKKISQEKLAKEIGVERSTIGKYETGSMPSMEILSILCNYFNVSTDYLLGIGNCRTLNDTNDIFPDLTEQEKTLIRLFRETTEEGRFEMIAAFTNIKNAIEKKDQNADTSSAC